MSSEEILPNLLHGHLWQTTSHVRYQMIIEAGCILPNPSIPDQERWNAGAGSEFYPYVRSIGGVSLFDFKGFDPEPYCKKYPISYWQEFVPYRREWGQVIWIEINRQVIAEGFISGEMLLAKWHQDKAHKHNIMPKIETAHLGPIPLEAFSRVFKCGNKTDGFEEVLV